MYYLLAWHAPKPRSHRGAARLVSDIARLEPAPSLLADLADALSQHPGVEIPNGSDPRGSGRLLAVSLHEADQAAVDAIAHVCRTRGVVLFDPQVQTVIVPSMKGSGRTVEKALRLRAAVEAASILEGPEIGQDADGRPPRELPAKPFAEHLGDARAPSDREYVRPLGVSHVAGIPPALTFALPARLKGGRTTQAELAKTIAAATTGDISQRRHATLELGGWLNEQSAHEALWAVLRGDPDPLTRSIAAVGLASQGRAPLAELLPFANELVAGSDVGAAVDAQGNLAKSVAAAAAAAAAIQDGSADAIADAMDIAVRLRRYPTELERAEAIQRELGLNAPA